jgi:hypothetical protein
MDEQLVEGVEIKIGRKTFIVPPLTFGLLKKLKPQLELLSTVDASATELSDDKMNAMVDVVHAALMRNYPNLARADLEDDLDIGNVPKIMEAITLNSGLKRLGEANPEAK